MSYTIDANILLYATNEDSAFHIKAKEFIESCANGNETWYLSWTAIHAFIRISTHPKIMPRPLTPHEAVSVIDTILGLTLVQTIAETDNNLDFCDI
ncbi:MAG: hypothetical protein GF398_00020 [Chitinivibrionales bacterium]|nr:hypothetical protein [Chitinivibrionales bacterium]